MAPVVGVGVGVGFQLPVGATVAASGDISFGEFTASGAGATAISGVSDGTYGEFDVASNVITPNTSPLTVGDADVSGVTVSVVANEASVASVAEAETAATATGTSTARTIRFRDGDYSSSGTATRLTYQTARTATLTFAADTHRGAIIPGVDLVGASDVTLSGLDLYKVWESPTDDNNGVVRAEGADISILDCEIRSNPLATANFGDPPEVLIGFLPITDCDNFTMMRCYMHDLSENAFKGANMTIQGNLLRDIYANCGKFSSNMDGLTFKDNHMEGLWAASSNGNASEQAEDPHSALVGFVIGDVDTVTAEGNIFLVSNRRATLRDESIQDSHVGDIDGEGRGWGWDEQGDTVTYPNFPTTGSYRNITFRANIWGINLGTVIRRGFLNSTWENETVFVDPNVGIASPGTGITAMRLHNVGMRLNAGLTPDIFDADEVDADTYEQSFANTIIPYGEGASVMEEFFDGPFDVPVTLDNVLTKMAAKAGGPLTHGERTRGAIGSHYTWATGVGTPDYVAGTWNGSALTVPSSSLTTGQTLSRVVFDGTTRVSLTNPMTGFSNQMTFQIGLQMSSGSDGTAQVILGGTGSDILLERVADGRILYRFDDSVAGTRLANGYMPQLLQEADGYKVITCSINTDTGFFEIMMSDDVMGLVRQITANDNYYHVGTLSNVANLSIGRGSTGTKYLEAEVSHFWMVDEAIDLLDSAEITKLVGQDGLPANLGADGSTPTGTQAIHYFTGTAASWTTNLGSGADASVAEGALTDASAPDTTAPVLSLPTGAANGQNGATSLGVTTDEGNGTLYWGIYPDASTPSAADIVAGTGATVSGSQAVSGTGVQSVSNQTGLTTATAYKAHYVHDDAASNRSNVATSATFTTDAASATDIMAGVGDFSSSAGWTLGAGLSITGGQLVAATSGSVRAERTGITGDRIAVGAGETISLEFDVVSGDLSKLFIISILPYNSSNVQVGSNTDIFISSTDSMALGTNTKPNVYTTPADTASIRVWLEFIHSPSNLVIDDVKMLI